MTTTRLILAACCLAAAWAQSQQPHTTPVPILKQINRQNEDGSYSYGYEGADGSYKIETKHPTGEVYGKYGYVDDTGNLREIEYGANKLGFQPTGTGVNVAPPTLPDPNSANYVGSEGEDDGQYREDPSIYWKDPKYNQGAPRYTASAPAAKPAYTQTSFSQPSYSQASYSQPRYTQNSYSQPAQPAQPAYTQSAQPAYNQPAYSQPSYSQFSQPAPQTNTWQRSWNPAPAPAVDQSIFRGHPASNFDVYSGSYSVNYK